MARKSNFEEMFEMLVSMPWWVGVAAAGVFWFVAVFVAPSIGSAQFRDVTQPILKLFMNVLAFMALVAAAVSAMKAASRRQLLNKQTGIESLRSISWLEFERLVGEAFRRQGYHVEETAAGADGGVDLVLRGNGETVLVQCKQWKATQVGVDKVRELFGVVTSEGANRGILVCSGAFTQEAQSFKVGKPLTLIDGPALAQLIRNVQPPSPASAPRLAAPAVTTAKDCPVCGSPMALRTAKRGANAGSNFYGCTKYPACKGTRPAE